MLRAECQPTAFDDSTIVLPLNTNHAGQAASRCHDAAASSSCYIVDSVIDFATSNSIEAATATARFRSTKVLRHPAAYLAHQCTATLASWVSQAPVRLRREYRPGPPPRCCASPAQRGRSGSSPAAPAGDAATCSSERARLGSPPGPSPSGGRPPPPAPKLFTAGGAPAPAAAAEKGPLVAECRAEAESAAGGLFSSSAAASSASATLPSSGCRSAARGRFACVENREVGAGGGV